MSEEATAILTITAIVCAAVQIVLMLALKAWKWWRHDRHEAERKAMVRAKWRELHEAAGRVLDDPEDAQYLYRLERAVSALR